ncbi:GNAT family N-acetyltransferase [Paenibacillus sp. CF384]|uniref:GNAT family N-acetyltransferase n=1 Tax=Paenibacillus sp. CF384 TaxID=1884382 RepID=UPI00089ACE79|nr:GNAT family N-acetyltransferase [Paenibacillus sp. CF384]SDX04735.1 Protein N-acetyltransferase, RimJ/RimL family [Paenibacillus sp. CF384]
MLTFHELEGERVRLLPLEREHAAPLFQAADDPRIGMHYPSSIRNMEETEAFIEKAIEGRKRGEQFPYAIFDKELQAFVGSTRYLRISEEHRNLNIGSTWYSPLVWRTRVNTEAKYLLLRHAFEAISMNRVEIITTPDNVRSQRAIERLGAVKEGVLRKKYRGLDYIVYSILDSEWQEVKSMLEGYLDASAYK